MVNYFYGVLLIMRAIMLAWLRWTLILNGLLGNRFRWDFKIRFRKLHLHTRVFWH